MEKSLKSRLYSGILKLHCFNKAYFSILFSLMWIKFMRVGIK